MTSSQPINGVVMKGAFFVNMKQHDNGSPEAPQDYIDDSLKIFLKLVSIMPDSCSIREAFERGPESLHEGNRIRSESRR